ncbi:glycoside hydrolase [Fistulina hepatica ATCC 64428]|uniref:Beta-xylanase n=1 Tax=Fistulina hepatica ATCC 64428 TaxID=1128425 RepID=A0A0D7AD19_9AGAR|nr:glycoside hydrolase [Fistulina hepatica ATCC 64428]
MSVCVHMTFVPWFTHLMSTAEFASFIRLNPLKTFMLKLDALYLNAAAKNDGKLYFGSATDNDELNDTAYLAILSNTSQFGQITAENSMKWDATEPYPNVFTFAAGDVIADLAESNGQLLRGHNCVWYDQLPSWVTNTSWTYDELASVVENHCFKLVRHYAGHAWDVINEPFYDNGSFRADVFYDTLGTEYIPIALNAARSADPSAKLYINEYNLEYASAKSDAMVALVEELLADGVPIDGIGFEAHMIVGSVPTSIATQMELFTTLGLEVAITELDIRMELPPTEALLAQQKTDYDTVISACKSVEKCIGMTVWDYTDKYSWIPSAFPGEGAACPWNKRLQTKPAYYGILEALGA